jgi:hypothetical protein
MSGKSVRRPVKAKDLISFPDEPKAATPSVSAEEHKRLSLEIAKTHKAKFWTKIKDSEIEKLEKTGK